MVDVRSYNTSYRSQSPTPHPCLRNLSVAAKRVRLPGPSVGRRVAGGQTPGEADRWILWILGSRAAVGELGGYSSGEMGSRHSYCCSRPE